MCWEGFCWNFNLTGAQKKAAVRSFVSSLELFVAGSVSAVSSGAAQNVFVVGIVRGTNTPSHEG